MKRLQEQLETINQQLKAKQEEVIQAENELKDLEEVLRNEKEILEQLNANVAELEEAVHQAKAQLEADLECLRELTDYLHQQEQLELEMQKAYEDQLTATNQAQDRANEIDRQEREAELAADRAVREQLQAEAVVGRLESLLNASQIALALLLVALAVALSFFIIGEILASPILAEIVVVKLAIDTLKNQLNAAKTKSLEANTERDRVLNEHERAKTEKQLPDQALVEEEQKLANCKTNWEKQIAVKNAAKDAVDQQNAIVQTDLEHLKDVQQELDTAREQQAQQATKVHKIEIQVKEKENQIKQLKAEQNALELRQEQTRNALEQAKTTLNQAEQRHEQAKTKLTGLEEQLKTKISQINDTNRLIQIKQTDLDKVRADYLLKEKAAYEIKNKLNLINKELETTADSKQKLNEQIQIQQKSISTKNKQSESLIAENKTLQGKLDVLGKEKVQLERQVEEFNQQLNKQNQVIIDKTYQMNTVLTNLEKKTHEKMQIEVRHAEHTAQAQHIRTQIDEYQTNIRQTEIDLQELQMERVNQAKAQKVNEFVDFIHRIQFRFLID